MENVLNLSITELAALYRQKQVSPVEVVKLSFERQQKIGKALNAFITVTEEPALRQAKKAEEAFLGNKPSHLLAGIPYSAKDLFYTEGIRTTCASHILKDFVPDYSATAISKLDAAGAVMLGKTNMLEFAYGIVHPDFGKTNNPWDLAKTSGGSSGGSAAAVASGIGYFSLGSDTGGSIRIPASYCGVAGLKPTRGLVSVHGVFPLSGSLDHAGPLARNALDAALVLEVIAGFDPQDPHSLTGGSGEVDISNFSALDAKHVGVLPERLLRGLTPEVARIYKETLQHVRSLGWHIDEVEIEGWARMEEIIMAVLLPEAAQIHQQWLSRKEEYASMTYRQIEQGMAAKAVDYLNGQQNLKHFTSAVSTLFNTFDLLLMPTVSFAALAEDPVIGSEEDEMLFTGPFNISGHPAVSVNMGFTADGLPVGMQLAAPHFQDIELLRAAHQLETMRSARMPSFD